MCVEQPNKEQAKQFLHDPSCTMQCPFIVSFVVRQLVPFHAGGKENCRLRNLLFPL